MALFTILAGRKHLQLKPGGVLTAQRSAGLWRGTVTIRHNGILDKNKIKQSKWLQVQSNTGF